MQCYIASTEVAALARLHFALDAGNAVVVRERDRVRACKQLAPAELEQAGGRNFRDKAGRILRCKAAAADVELGCRAYRLLVFENEVLRLHGVADDRRVAIEAAQAALVLAWCALQSIVGASGAFDVIMLRAARVRVLETALVRHQRVAHVQDVAVIVVAVLIADVTPRVSHIALNRASGTPDLISKERVRTVKVLDGRSPTVALRDKRAVSA